MLDSKPIQVFIQLSQDERRKFRKWMNLNFVEKNKELKEFFIFLDTRSVIKEDTVTKEKAFRYVYKETAYDDARMRQLLWMLSEALEEFIVLHNISRHISLKEQILSSYYMDRRLYKYANQQIEQGIQLVEQHQLHDADYYLNLFHLQSRYFLINQRNEQNQRFHLDDIINASTIFYVISLLKYACISQSFQKNTGNSMDHLLLEHIIKTLPDAAFFTLPQVRIYYNIYLVNTTDNESAFAHFLEDIKTHEHIFSAHNLNDLYRLAINFCIRKTNQNQLDYTRKAFELYLYAVEKEYLLLNNEINRFIFTNIIALGIKLKEYEKIDTFLENYAGLIDVAYRQNTVVFNTARIFHSKQQLEEALKLLLTHEFKDTLLNLNAKYLTLKILFELRDIELFRTFLKSFKVYLKRQSNIGYHKTYFTNVGVSLSILLDIYKKPLKYPDFVFSNDTPDKDWFNTMIKHIVRTS